MDRAFFTAALAGGLSHADRFNEASAYVIVWALAWLFTTDPLPAAIDRGLEAFKERHRG